MGGEPTYRGRAGNSRNRLETGHSAFRGIASAPPEPALRQTLDQRLRLGDLGHFGRRREAFERRREDGVGVDGAAGRLVQFGERERGAKFEAARGLLFRDGDGGPERLLRRRRRWRDRA